MEIGWFATSEGCASQLSRITGRGRSEKRERVGNKKLGRVVEKIFRRMLGLAVFVAVLLATAVAVAPAGGMAMTAEVAATIRTSPLYQSAMKRMRAERVARGLTPDVVPHSEYVRMRDGTLLWTTYWDPRLDPLHELPVVLVRSPYTILGTQNMADLFLPFGFAAGSFQLQFRSVVVALTQDVSQWSRTSAAQAFRAGTFASGWKVCTTEGEHNDFACAASLELILFFFSDTMAWIQGQSFSNGQVRMCKVFATLFVTSAFKVFQIGFSADGILSLVDLKTRQPAMAGQWLMATTSFPYTTLLQNGQAFRQALSHDWLASMQLARPKIPPGTYYETALRNEGFNSSYEPPGSDCGSSNFSWYKIDLFQQDFRNNVNFPAVHSGGWYDIFLAPTIETFGNYEFNSSVGALGQQQLFIDPRGHCFFEKTVSFPDDRMGLLWAYERALDAFKNQVEPKARAIMPPSPKEFLAKSEAAPVDKLVLYVMGPDEKYVFGQRKRRGVTGMYWTGLKAWPQTVPYQLFMSPGRKLSYLTPQRSVLSYSFNPSNPTPTIGGNNLFLRCGPQNQTSNDMRSDNLIFDHLFDRDIAIIGSVSVSLRVVTDRNDTDFVVRLSDVYPGGHTSMLLSDNIVRMRWRDSRTVRSTTVPGREYVVTLTMWQLCYVFNAGHSLRVAITSSNHPRFSLNLNNDLLVWQGGAPLVANNTVILGQDTFVSLPTVGLDQLPKIHVFRG